MPPAARITDPHVCPKVEPGPTPHVGGPVLSGAGTVFIGYMPAARRGDQLICVGPPDEITGGAAKVLIENKPAARLGDSTQHGGTILAGCPTVKIGDSPQGSAFQSSGAPLVEVCEPSEPG